MHKDAVPFQAGFAGKVYALLMTLVSIAPITLQPPATALAMLGLAHRSQKLRADRVSRQSD